SRPASERRMDRHLRGMTDTIWYTTYTPRMQGLFWPPRPSELRRRSQVGLEELVHRHHLRPRSHGCCALRPCASSWPPTSFWACSATSPPSRLREQSERHFASDSTPGL